jgi:hypothetical protein
VNPVPSADFKRSELLGLTIHERIKRVASLWARSGFRVTALTLPPAWFCSVEQAPAPFLTVCDSGLALILLGTKVPVILRFDGIQTMRMEFREVIGGQDSARPMTVEVDLSPKDDA